MAKRRRKRKRGRGLWRHEMTADHVRPLGLKGYDRRKNIVPCTNITKLSVG